MENNRTENKSMIRWRSLSGRLAGMLAVTFLPVNLLAIIVCGVILIQSSRQVQDSYQREMDTALSQLRADLDKTEERFSDFLISYMTELTLAEVSAPLTSYEMLDELHDVMEYAGRTGMVFLFEKADEKLFLRYTSGAYPIPQIEVAKKELEEHCLQSQGTRAENSALWEILAVAGSHFLYRQFEYNNYQIGFLLDMGKYLEGQEESLLWKENQVYLESDGAVYTYSSGKIKLQEDREWEDIFIRRFFDRNVQGSMEGADLKIGIKMVGKGFRGSAPKLYWVLMAVAVCSVFLVLGMWAGLKKRVVNALLVMKNGMEELEQEHLDYRISDWDKQESEEFVFLYNSFNHMAEELALSREKDIKVYQVQLDNLRLQVNPHMLLNSFNMIYSLAQSKNYQCIQQYAMLLVEYFRYSLKEMDHFVLLKNEMAFVENYTSIQKIRFPGAFTSVHNIQEECREALVPPLPIENFVENAMKYAIIPDQTIEVLINIRKEEDQLLISICDTGRGIKPEILECLRKGEVYKDKMGKEHIGVWNCRRRMEVFYGDKASLNIMSTPGQGTQVWMAVPFMTVMDREEEKCTKAQ